MIKITRKGHGLWLGIDRPARKNALDSSTWRALDSALDQRGEARVLLLHGSDDAFCSGADLRELQDSRSDSQALAASNALIEAVQLKLQRLPIPTVALVDGVCFGAGVGLTLACDFRIATTRSRFGLAPAKLGLLYSLADTQRLLRAVGSLRAREMLLTGKILDAETALGWGLVGELVAANQLHERANDLAESLSRAAPNALAGIKRSLSHLEGDPTHTEQQARRWFSDAFLGEEFGEGLQAFFEKRPPGY